MRKILLITSLLIGGMLTSCQSDSNPSVEESVDDPTVFAHTIPIGENSWIEGGNSHQIITAEGIRNWTTLDQEITTYIRVNKAGVLDLGLELRVPQGSSKLQAEFAGKTVFIDLDNSEYKTIELGEFDIPEPGYYALVLKGEEKTGSEIAQIDSLLVGGPASDQGVQFVEDNFHFGRRGPSVHLRFDVPQEKEALYFYSEIEVPQGEDVIGSYYMANGFAHGYFGIQVNSPTERRILFSVWSPFETQDPSEIPEEYRIELLAKGQGVITGEFGNEGSGGQSYKVFDWKVDTSYGFLLKGEPYDDNNTDYTAWFHDTSDDSWHLIASFRRPDTHTYLSNLYSFLENFVPDTGDVERMAEFKNQWMYDTDGNWTEFTQTTFTADATANSGHRLDYDAGAQGATFYMRNCGFFDDYTQTPTEFTRESSGSEPVVDFQTLPWES